MLKFLSTHAYTLAIRLVSGILVLALLLVFVVQTWNLVTTTWPSSHQREVNTALSAGVVDKANAAEVGASGVNAPPQTAPSPPSSAVMEVKNFASAANGRLVPSNTFPALVNDPKDAIANAMTAIGTAVGVLALILAVGTSWFAAKQKELSDLIARQDKEFGEKQHVLDEIVAAQERREQLAVLLSQAKRAVYAWVNETSNNEAKPMMAAEIAANLEFVMSDDPSIRKLSFARLTEYPWADDEAVLIPARQYTEACHLFHGRKQLAEKAWAQTGVWCRIFWDEERKRFQKDRDQLS